MPYTLNQIGDFSAVGLLSRALGSGLPASFSTGFLSVWICGIAFFLRSQNGDIGVEISTDDVAGNVTVNLFNGGSQIVAASYTGTVRWPTQRHLLVSFDTAAQVLAVYVNRVALPPIFAGWSSSAPIANPSGPPSRMVVSATSVAPAYFGDMWFKAGGTFINPATAGVLDKFIDAGLLPVDLGADGSIPFGTAPQIFLHTAGTPDDFATNHGSGGAWTNWGDGSAYTPGTLSAEPDGYCTGPSPPDPDPNFPLSPEVQKVLLPSAELQFADANGHPYAAGTLETLVPGTSTPKDTWSDPEGAALNTNPIVLDAAGRCVVFGDGAYRTILRDAAHNLVWDKPSFTYVSAAMMPVVGAPTIADAVALLGIQDGVDGAVAAEAAIRAAADAAELAGRAAGDTFLSEQLIAENARAVAAEAALQAQIDGLPGPASVDVLLRRGSATSGALGAVTIAFPTPFPLYCMTFGLDTSTFDTTGGFEVLDEVVTASGVHFTFTFGDGTTPRVGVAFNYWATGY